MGCLRCPTRVGETAAFGSVNKKIGAPAASQMVLITSTGHENSEYMLSFEIGQRERGFYSRRTESQSDSHPVPYYNVDIVSSCLQNYYSILYIYIYSCGLQLPQFSSEVMEASTVYWMFFLSSVEVISWILMQVMLKKVKKSPIMLDTPAPTEFGTTDL